MASPIIFLPSKPLLYYLSVKFLLYIAPRYFLKLVAHKLFIILFGLYINFRLRDSAFHVPFRRLVFHDWSKFSLFEFVCYADHFFGDSTGSGFNESVMHHFQRQDHHAEFWWGEENLVYPSTPDHRRKVSRSSTTRKMSDVAVTELVVDWHAAEIAYVGNIPRPGSWSWIRGMKDNCGLHPVSDMVLHALFVFLGFDEEWGDDEVFAERVKIARKFLDREEDDFTCDKVSVKESFRKVRTLLETDKKKFAKYLEKL